MILLLLAVMKDFLVPASRKLDRFDHFLLWVINICLVVLFLTLPEVVFAEPQETVPDTTTTTTAIPEFFMACSRGKLDDLKSYLTEHPEWIHARTENGEACLHLTGIQGLSELTEYLLENGADPNIRSTYEHGLRMHPLSWNIYGGHIGNVDLLLRYGADPNLDFDGMSQSKEAVTVLDVVELLVKNEKGDGRFVQIEKMLRDHGAKTMKELHSDAGKSEL